MISKKRKKYLDYYQKDNYQTYCIRFNLNNDKEIIKKLETIPNKTEYIRKLINKDLASKK